MAAAVAAAAAFTRLTLSDEKINNERKKEMWVCSGAEVWPVIFSLSVVQTALCTSPNTNKIEKSVWTKSSLE